jgi:hypothetical protein
MTVSERKMAVFDDMEPDRKVTVHDKGEIQMPEGRISTHTGDIWSPHIDASEPLRLECEHFPRCVERREPRQASTRACASSRCSRRCSVLERGGETLLAAAAR